jgi:HlyD family secretion protein
MARPSSPAAAIAEIWTDEDAPEAREFTRARRVLAIGGGLLLVLLLLAAVVPIGGAVIASGAVGVETRVKRIANPTGGTIAAILVENGQKVEQGQLLMRLKDKVSGAEAQYSGLSVEQLLAQRARLEAEQSGSGRVVFAPALLDAGTPTAAQAMSDELKLFATRQAEQTQMHAQLQARIAQYGEQNRGYNAQIASLQRQLALIKPELDDVRLLWEKKLVTITHLTQLEPTAAPLDGQIASLQANIAETDAHVSETREQSIQVDQTRRIDAASQLEQVNAALNDQSVRSISANVQKQETEIRAPYAGTVEKLAYTTVGDVVRPAEPIMEIVPSGQLTVIEAMVRPSDIDQLAVGQKARIRFTAFAYTSTPEIPGKVTYVATDRTTNPDTGAAFYSVRVEIDRQALAAQHLQLRSGMPAELFIGTGERSLLSYLTKPLRDQIARAFRGD